MDYEGIQVTEDGEKPAATCPGCTETFSYPNFFEVGATAIYVFEGLCPQCGRPLPTIEIGALLVEKYFGPWVEAKKRANGIRWNWRTNRNHVFFRGEEPHCIYCGGPLIGTGTTPTGLHDGRCEHCHAVGWWQPLIDDRT